MSSRGSLSTIRCKLLMKACGGSVVGDNPNTICGTFYCCKVDLIFPWRFNSQMYSIFMRVSRVGRGWENIKTNLIVSPQFINSMFSNSSLALLLRLLEQLGAQLTYPGHVRVLNVSQVGVELQGQRDALVFRVWSCCACRGFKGGELALLARQ